MSDEQTISEKQEAFSHDENDNLPVEVEQVPEGWSLSTIEEVTTRLVGGGTPSRSEEKYWGGRIPWASVKDLDGPILEGTEESITEQGLSQSTANKIPPGSVVLSTRMTVGEAFLNKYNLAINQDLKALLPDQSSVNSLYLTFALREKNAYLKSLGRGTTVSGITTSDVSRTHLALPPLTEQRKIASVLYTVDCLVETNRNILKKVDRLRRGLARELFEKGAFEHSDHSEGHHRSRITRYPGNWDVVPAGDVMKVSRGAHPRPKSDATLWGGSIPIIKIGDRDKGDGRIISDTSDYVTAKGAKDSKLVQEGTLLVSNAGTCGVARITGQESCVHDHWLILEEYENSLNRRYLFHYINYNQGFLSALATGSTVDDLNTDDFRLFDIAIPPLQEQVRIANILDDWYDVKAHIKQTIDRTRRLKAGLMQDLLTGEVRTDYVDVEIPEEVAAYG